MIYITPSHHFSNFLNTTWRLTLSQKQKICRCWRKQHWPITRHINNNHMSSAHPQQSDHQSPADDNLPPPLVRAEFTITLPTPQFAAILAKTILVDSDIKEGRLTREVTHDGSQIHVVVQGPDAKTVRVVVGSMLEMMNLSTKTMALFAPRDDYIVPHNPTDALLQKNESCAPSVAMWALMFKPPSPLSSILIVGMTKAGRTHHNSAPRPIIPPRQPTTRHTRDNPPRAHVPHSSRATLFLRSILIGELKLSAAHAPRVVFVTSTYSISLQDHVGSCIDEDLS